MYCTRKVTDDLFYVGGSDRRLALFENVFPIPNGISYNSYLLLDEKTVLFDTVDFAISRQFFENIEYVLNGKPLNLVVINHMEPDHCACIGDIIRRYPDVRLVCNTKTVAMLKQFFSFDIDSRIELVKEGDSLCTGKHNLTFLMAPMVHWPEVMVTYDSTDKVLFSADAFGTFGALNGNIFADELNFDRDWLNETRRYFVNIVGKYGMQVQSLLKKASTIDIDYICPLHGPIWRSDLDYIINKHNIWSSYQPEDSAVLIAYASVYGDTENVANIVATKLAESGIKNIAMYDVSVTHPSYLVSEAFRCSHIVFASTTYNAGIFINMETLLLDLKAHNLQNKTVAIIQNGTWAPTAGKLMKDIVSSMKDMTIIENQITVKSSLKDNQVCEIDEFVKELVLTLKK